MKSKVITHVPAKLIGIFWLSCLTVLIISCSKDNDEQNDQQSAGSYPQLQILAPSSNPINVAAGESFSLSVVAMATDGKTLVSFEIEEFIGGELNSTSKIDINDTSFELLNHQVAVDDSPGVAVFNFKITDSKNLVTTKTINVNIEEASVDFKPYIAFQTGGGFTSNDVEINQNESIEIGVLAQSNSQSNADLERVSVVLIVNDVVVETFVDSSFNSSTFSEFYTLHFADPLEGKILAEIRDKDGKSNAISFNIVVNEIELGNTEEFIWQRNGGSPATGLATFGLKWISNGKKVSANITKDGAEKFVLLQSGNWNEITSYQELEEAINMANDMDVYSNISVMASSDYNEVLGVKYNDQFFLLHIYEATVEVNTQGIVVTIFGEYKE